MRLGAHAVGGRARPAGRRPARRRHRRPRQRTVPPCRLLGDAGPTGARRPPRVDLVRGSRRGPHAGCSTSRSSCRRWTCIYGHGCQGVLTGPAPELDAGLLLLRRPLHRRRRRGRGRAPRSTASTDEPVAAPQARRKKGGWLAQGRRRRAHHARGRRRLHLPQPPGFAGGAGCALHHAALDGRRAADGLEARRVLAAPAAPAGAHRRARPRHLDAAGVEAARLGRGRPRVPLVVHRQPGRVRRRTTASTCTTARRDRRADRAQTPSTSSLGPAPAGGSAGAPTTPAPPPGAVPPARSLLRPAQCLLGRAGGGPARSSRRLRMRMASGVTSTSSSSAMNSIAVSRVCTLGRRRA